MGRIAGTVETVIYLNQQVFSQALIGIANIGWNEIMLQQPANTAVPEAFTVESGALDKVPRLPVYMNPADQSAHLFQQSHIIQIGSAPAATVEYCKAKFIAMMQGDSVCCHGWHHRQFVLGEFYAEGVFLQNRFVTPAARAVKLGHDIAGILGTYLVNTVLVAVKRQQSAIAAVTK